MNDVDEVQRNVLVECLEDYVGLWEVARLVQDLLGIVGVDETRRASLERLRPLLVRGLVRAGDLVSDGGFVPWTRQGVVAAERIDSEWTGLGRDPNIAELCWLDSTPLGDTLARSVAG